MKNIGKPCAGKLHARFDEGGQARACPLLYPFFIDSDIECRSRRPAQAQAMPVPIRQQIGAMVEGRHGAITQVDA